MTTYFENSGVKTISMSLWIRAFLGHHWSNAVRLLSMITVIFKWITSSLDSVFDLWNDWVSSLLALWSCIGKAEVTSTSSVTKIRKYIHSQVYSSQRMVNPSPLLSLLPLPIVKEKDKPARFNNDRYFDKTTTFTWMSDRLFNMIQEAFFMHYSTINCITTGCSKIYYSAAPRVHNRHSLHFMTFNKLKVAKNAKCAGLPFKTTGFPLWSRDILTSAKEWYESQAGDTKVVHVENNNNNAGLAGAMAIDVNMAVVNYGTGNSPFASLCWSLSLDKYLAAASTVETLVLSSWTK